MSARSNANAALRVALEVADTEAEGPGRRYALWVQGCPLRCPGCCNPHMLKDEGGTLVDVEELSARVLAAHERHALEGITFLGGEPFAQAEALARVAAAVRRAGMSVMVFSGHRLEQLRERPDARRLLAHVDLLVDGPYERALPDHTRRWIGSTNQRRHHLTERYDEHDPRFVEPNQVELRLRDGRLTIVGEPGAIARLGPISTPGEKTSVRSGPGPS